MTFHSRRISISLFRRFRRQYKHLLIFLAVASGSGGTPVTKRIGANRRSKPKSLIATLPGETPARKIALKLIVENDDIGSTLYRDFLSIDTSTPLIHQGVDALFKMAYGCSHSASLASLFKI